jgi:hypothetical protein
MEGTEFREQEQWIEKYRAAVEAVSKKPVDSPGLGAFVDGVRLHLQVAFRTARARLRKSIPPLEPGENVIAPLTATVQPPIANPQTKDGVTAEPLASSSLERAS